MLRRSVSLMTLNAGIGSSQTWRKRAVSFKFAIEPNAPTWRPHSTTNESDSSDNQELDELPLPYSLPEAPDWPCPLLTLLELETYIPMLYSRKWGISLNDAAIERLSCKFRFKKYGLMMDFVQSIGRIAEEEKVCLTVMLISKSGILTYGLRCFQHHPEVTFDARSVFVHVYTHSACIPSRDGEGEEKASGITLRDIRFAVLLERIFEGLQAEQQGLVGRLNPKSLERPLPYVLALTQGTEEK